jgi:hypothetical protein
MAVPTWRPTTNGSQNDSGWLSATTRRCHPNSCGRITVCPRLDTGNSSVTPWISPRMIACR